MASSKFGTIPPKNQIAPWWSVRRTLATTGLKYLLEVLQIYRKSKKN